MGGVLAGDVAWSDSPFSDPPKCWLPKCKATLDICTTELATCDTDLGTCTTNLTETTTQLSICINDLETCDASAQAIPATGQTSCWDNNSLIIDCGWTGQDGDIQAGATLAYTDNGDGTITDENTGLMWMKQDDNNLSHPFFCGSLPDGLDKDCIFTWGGAFGFVASLNANTFAGYTDWRLANVKELVSIVNYENGFPLPAISAAFNTGCVPDCTIETCSCTQGNFYWSSTSIAFDPRNAWIVEFSFGNVQGHTFGDKVQQANRMRAVRGGQ